MCGAWSQEGLSFPSPLMFFGCWTTKCWKDYGRRISWGDMVDLHSSQCVKTRLSLRHCYS